MPGFTSFDQYKKFEKFVLSTRRYFLNTEALSFLDSLLKTSIENSLSLPKNKRFWRAQIGSSYSNEINDKKTDDKILRPFSTERMKPLRENAKEGRLNPKGIPYLYLSSTIKTSVLEVRPWVGAQVSVGKFTLTRTLKIANFIQRRDSLVMLALKNKHVDKNTLEEVVLSDVNNAFSRPISINDRVADYAPTQIIAEYLKDNGFEGVAYKSAMGFGYNICLFDIHTAEHQSCFLFNIEKIHVKLQNYAEPYYISSKE